MISIKVDDHRRRVINFLYFLLMEYAGVPNSGRFYEFFIPYNFTAKGFSCKTQLVCLRRSIFVKKES